MRHDETFRGCSFTYFTMTSGETPVCFEGKFGLLPFQKSQVEEELKSNFALTVDLN